MPKPGQSLQGSSLEPPSPDRSQPLLALNGATVMRAGRIVLDNLRFKIHEGEHTAILGPNGCGKSSLIRLINRQDYPLTGPEAPSPVQILGQARWDLVMLRAQLGIVSADLNQAFLGASGGGRRNGLEVVLSGFFASQGLFSHQKVVPAMLECAEKALSLVGADHLAGKRIEELSTGEARRLLIARALAPGPRALLLDEPTTGLDLVARHHFLRMLQELAQLGRTILLVTHHIEEILPEIQRVILLREGRVFLDGSKHEVLTSTHLSELYGASVRLQKKDGFYSALC